MDPLQPIGPFRPFRPNHPGAGAQRQSDPGQRLGQQPGPGQQSRGQAQQRAQTGLFGHHQHPRPPGPQAGGHRQQQRAAAGHHHPPAAQFQAALGQGLEAAGAQHPGQGPAGKGQEALPGAGGQDQPVVVELFGTLGPQQAQPSGPRGGDHPPAQAQVHRNGAQGPEPGAGPALARSAPQAAPDLAAGFRQGVHDGDRGPGPGRRDGRGQARRAGPHHQDPQTFNHGAPPCRLPVRSPGPRPARRRRPGPPPCPPPPG